MRVSGVIFSARGNKWYAIYLAIVVYGSRHLYIVSLYNSTIVPYWKSVGDFLLLNSTSADVSNSLIRRAVIKSVVLKIQSYTSGLIIVGCFFVRVCVLRGSCRDEIAKQASDRSKR